MDLANGTPEAVVLFNAIEGWAFLYELPFEVSDRQPPVSDAVSVIVAKRATLALLAAGFVTVMDEREGVGSAVELDLGAATEILATDSSWSLPSEAGGPPPLAIVATDEGESAFWAMRE